ncbi:hypothetical protein [Oerskovia turbata]
MARKFNRPPNWPAPPKGWKPPPGWEPDPAWGPPPSGWVLYTRAPMPAWGWWLIAGGVVLVLVLWSVVGKVLGLGPLTCESAIGDVVAMTADEPASGQIVDITDPWFSEDRQDELDAGTFTVAAGQETDEVLVCRGAGEWADGSSGAIEFGYAADTAGNLYTFFAPVG